MGATGFSNVSKDTFGVYPWDAFRPAMVEVGDCTAKDGGSIPDERLPDVEGLAAGSGEFSVLTVLCTGDAVGRAEIGGIGEG